MKLRDLLRRLRGQEVKESPEELAEFYGKQRSRPKDKMIRRTGDK